jgi:hypothetical protein
MFQERRVPLGWWIFRNSYVNTSNWFEIFLLANTKKPHIIVIALNIGELNFCACFYS